MTGKEIGKLFSNLAKNIHYTTGTAEEDYPKLDKEFYELIPQIKALETPYKITDSQCYSLYIGFNFIAMNNLVRKNIIGDFFSIRDKIKISPYVYAGIIAQCLQLSIYTKDVGLEKIVFAQIPEKLTSIDTMVITGGGVALKYNAANSLGFSLFLYYYLNGEKEKAKIYLKEVLQQTKNEIDTSELSSRFQETFKKKLDEINEFIRENRKE